ncbi:hypothetical protein HMPREF1136_0400 [Actinomyces sp. ICM47]|nr:hypothetical protein HMPREF1136_0400 [Actinomyces sp. ICM47]
MRGHRRRIGHAPIVAGSEEATRQWPGCAGHAARERRGCVREGACLLRCCNQYIGAGQMLLAHVVATFQRTLWLPSAGSNTHPDR